jgi:hypothetical protein
MPSSNALAPTPTNSLAAYMQRQMGFDPNVERLSFLPYPQGALTKGSKIDWSNWVAPQIAYDAAKAYMLPGYAARGGRYDPEDVANMAMNVAGGGMAIGRAPANSLAMNVYHGTPHRFAATERNPLGEFRASQIGTGEGAQAYGHGLYFAENPEVAKGYKKTLAYKAFDVEPEAEKIGIPLTKESKTEFYRQANANSDPYEAAKRLQYASIDARKISQEKLAELFKGYYDKGGGTMYHVDLPNSMVEKMLHFDKPLSQQSKYVKDAINKSNYALRDMAYDLFGASDPTGQQIAKASLNPKEFAEHMRSVGVPGIQYLDAGSRGVGGTRNFVVFPGEEKNLTILKQE